MQSNEGHVFSVFFSIIVPVYKAEKFLPRCIDSILVQTYSDFELILVDDGSPDNSLYICQKYAQKDDRIHIIRKSNGGASGARNAGIRAACGKYIMFVDSDDFWKDSCALQLVFDAIHQYACDVLCTNFYKVYDNKKPDEKYFPHTEPLIGTEQVLLHERYVSGVWSKIISASLFQNNRLDFVENVCSEDIDWSLRLALEAKNITYVDIAFYCYLQRTDSISHSMTEKKLSNLYNNVTGCISLMKTQSPSVQRFLRPYVGYQYAILLSDIAATPDAAARNAMLPSLKHERALLRASSSPKVRLMYLSSKLFGFGGMMHLLSLYSRLKK